VLLKYLFPPGKILAWFYLFYEKTYLKLNINGSLVRKEKNTGDRHEAIGYRQRKIQKPFDPIANGPLPIAL
jgi:hypothetical protein